MSVENTRILLAVCGSIAAFKACELVRALMREGAEISVATSQPRTMRGATATSRRRISSRRSGVK